MKKRNIIFVLFFCCLCATAAVAQNTPELTVVSFEEKPFDTAARDSRYKIVDGNGDLFSIIKLRSTTPDDNLRAYSFDFGLCESRIKEVDGEVWVYVQRNAMRATIKHDGYKTLKYELNTTVQPGKVYEMVLAREALKVQKQMVHFKLTPAVANATIMYRSNKAGSDELQLGLTDSNGELAESLPLGTYSYKVITMNYHNSEGVIELDDINSTHTAHVTLRPRFATIKLEVEQGVEIYIDGKSYGIGGWSGNLNAGSYNVECRKAGYRNGIDVIKIEEGKNGTIKLKALEPIFGSLSLKSSPLGAAIAIDGADYGKTPRIVNELLIGEHKVVLLADGYEPATSTVTIKEGETESVDITLQEKKLAATSQPATDASATSLKTKTKRKDMFHVGLTASYGYMLDLKKESSVYDENDKSINAEAGILFCIGSPTKSKFNFITGAKYQFMQGDSLNYSQVVLPLNLNWNYSRSKETTTYFGVGFEPGMEIGAGKTGFCWNASVQLIGVRSGEHDFCCYIRYCGTYAQKVDARSGLLIGLSYSYFF